MKFNLFLNDQLAESHDSSRPSSNRGGESRTEALDRETEGWQRQAHGGPPETILFKVTDSGKVYFNPDELRSKPEQGGTESPLYGEMFYTSLIHGAAGIGFKSYRDRFERLKERWIEDTFFASSVSDMVTHEAYQRIIGMGLPAVPLLLEDLRDEPQHWFWALEAITGVNPVPKDERGNISSMSERWIKWGKESGLLGSKMNNIFQISRHVGSRKDLPEAFSGQLPED